MSDEDIALDEKRIYEDRREQTTAFVACEMGVARVDCSDDQIGRFGLEHRCTTLDIAGHDGRLAVATDEDVLVGGADGFEPTGFGPAVAVGIAETVVAAAADGTVARLAGDEWGEIGSVGTVRAIDGDLLAGAAGVYRVAGEELVALGQRDARDVAAAGPYAATDDGLFRWSDGWLLEAEGHATLVAAEYGGDRAHAVVDGDLRERSDGEWQPAQPPEDGVAAVAYDAATVAVTRDGVVMLDPVTAKDGRTGWRSRTLGLTGVVGVAVP